MVVVAFRWSWLSEVLFPLPLPFRWFVLPEPPLALLWWLLLLLLLEVVVVDDEDEDDIYLNLLAG